MIRSRTPLTALVLVAASLAAGCSDDDDVAVIGPEWDQELGEATLYLQPVEGCAEAEQAMRDAAYQELKHQLYAEMTSWLENREAWCESDDDFFGSVAEAGDDGGDALEGSVGSGGDPADDAGEGPDDVSETNNQVEGVDEADFLKTDEDGFIYVLSGDSLHVVEAWPAEETDRIGGIAIEGTPKKLFVRGDRALVYSSLVGGQTEVCDEYGCYPASDVGECTYGYDCQFRGDGHPTKLTVLDISDRTSPVVVRELRANGSLLAARRVDDVVHTVLTLEGPQFPIDRSDGGVQCDDGDAPAAQDIVDAYTAILLKNKKIIQETPISTVMPSLTDSAAESDALAACPAFYKGRVAAGAGFTTLVSLSIAASDPPTASTVLSQPGAVYASAESLYIAVPEVQHDAYGWYGGWEGAAEMSVVHRFALGTEGDSSYQASGAVKGRVLNQFAMDEHEGHLRLATTTGYAPDPEAHSTMSVLAQQGVDLVTVGDVDRIAPSEDIRSVRFAGDRGFVVTFKKTDPLFVFDLSTPSDPHILSELKIPGFSTYMHMMDDGHLLTIGYDADDHGDFAYFDGVMLQIFDVTDPQAPTLAHKEIIGTRGSSSEALGNHLAFNYFAPKDLLAIPMTICEGGDDGMFGDQMTFSGLMVYDVTAASGFALRGMLPFAAPEDQAAYGDGSCGGWWSNPSSLVKRSVIMDDFVYGVTADRIQVASLEAVDQPLADVVLSAAPTP